MSHCPDVYIKVLVIGESGCGKSSLVQRYVNNTFSVHTVSTLGVDFCLKTLRASVGSQPAKPVANVNLQLWDLAGQERANKLSRVYYRDAVAAIIVHDLSRPQTLEAAVKWKTDLDQSTTLPGRGDDLPPVPCILLGNKVDLVTASSIATKRANADSHTTRYGFSDSVLASAKTGQGVAEAIRLAVMRGLAAEACYTPDMPRDNVLLLRGGGCHLEEVAPQPMPSLRAGDVPPPNGLPHAREMKKLKVVESKDFFKNDDPMTPRTPPARRGNSCC
eukprot:PhM_4_TR1754/c0_g1_i1/m.98445